MPSSTPPPAISSGGAGDAFVPPARPLSTHDDALLVDNAPVVTAHNAIEMTGRSNPNTTTSSSASSSSSSSSTRGRRTSNDDDPPAPATRAAPQPTTTTGTTPRPSIAPTMDTSSQASISLADSSTPIAHPRPTAGLFNGFRFGFGRRAKSVRRRPLDDDDESTKVTMDASLAPGSPTSGKHATGVAPSPAAAASTDGDVTEAFLGSKPDLEYMKLRNGPSHAEIDHAHPGDAHPPLSREELKAFYAYAFAIEPIVVVGITAFIPLILQSLAAAAGKDVNDVAKPCNYTEAGYKCVVQVAGGAMVDVSSFVLYATSFSVALQAIFFISLGAVADHGTWRKRFMVGFMIGCGIFGVAFLTIRDSKLFAYGALLMVLANVCLGSSFVFYNAFIPIYAKVHWYVSSRTFTTPHLLERATENVCNAISAYSNILGYIGAIACFVLAGGLSFVVARVLPADSPLGIRGFEFGSAGVDTFGQQVGVAVTGLWVLVGSYFPIRYMRTRPGRPLPDGENYLFYSWKRVGSTIRRARKLPNTFLLLMAWFLLSDAMTTIGSVTILFAQNELGFSGTEIIAIAAAAPITAAGGNFLWLKFQQRYRWTTKQMLLLLVALMCGLPIYGILGLFLPFGLKAKWELFPAGIYYGCLLAAVQSFARVLFSELLPPGQEAEFFALYAITDKGSSWFGPLVVAAITDVSHQIRYGFLFLFVILVLSVVCVWYIDVEKGRKDIEAFREVTEAEVSGTGAVAATAV
ncbi:Autophagy protein 22 [Phlyctochytrium bullatum]|nr:Autophagy protein 22 [Phlyctochytrium bullatum]